MPTTSEVFAASSLWYPVMLAECHDEISESRAAELLSLSIEEYREKKWQAIRAVTGLITSLPSPMTSLLDIVLRDIDADKKATKTTKKKGSQHADD